MTTIRRRSILSLVSEIQEVEPNFSIGDCFCVLYENNTITGPEFDYLVDWMTL